MWRRFFLSVLLLSQLRAQDPLWVKLKSPNFEMYTTATAGGARETLRYFEQVRGFFVQVMGAIPGRPVPVRIVAFTSKKEYEPYSPNNFAVAFYHSTPTVDNIVLSQVNVAEIHVAIHEYVHLVVRHAGLKLPPWLNEGMAEVYSTLRPIGDKVVMGDIIPGRYQALLDQKWVPLAAIVAADHNSPYYNEKSRAGSLYNEGWALTHMLVLTKEYRPNFPQFAGMLSAGASTEEALQKVYNKSTADMDKEVKAYLRGGHFQGAVFALKLERGADEIPAEPASLFDVKLVLADVLNRPGKEQETRAAMEALSAEDPKRPEPFVTLGYLAWRAQQTDVTVKDFEKAFALGSRDATMLWDYGRLLRGRNRAEAVRVLSELVSLEPMRADFRMELAADQLTSKEPFAALATLKPVKNVSKEEAPRLFALRAHAYFDGGQFPEARASAQNLAKYALTDAEKSQAEQLLKALDARADHKSSSGTFVMLDCSGGLNKVVMETSEGKKVFLIDDPSKVLEMTCGAQKKAAIRVDYVPANRDGVDGFVRGISVQP